MLTFYQMKGSTPCMKVQLFLEEMGQKYEAIDVDLFKGEHKRSPLKDKNPLLHVPFIELDGFGVGESNTILRYLAQKWQKHDWYPTNLEARAQVDQWMDYTSAHINDYIGSLVWYRYFVPKLGLKDNPERVRFCENALLNSLPVLETHLQNRTYLAGHQPTLADLTLLPYLGIADRAHLRFEDFPAINAWKARMTQRPTWQKVRQSIDSYN